MDDVPYTGDLDLGLVSTRSDLAAALRTVHIRADKPSLRSLEARTRHSVNPLSKTVIAEMLRGIRFPRKAVMIAFLRARGVEEDLMESWRRAWDRIAATEEARTTSTARGRNAVQLADDGQVPPTADRTHGAPRPQTAGVRRAVVTTAAFAAEIEQLRDRVTQLSRDNEALRAQLGTSSALTDAPASDGAASDDPVYSRQARSPVISRRELGVRLRDLRLEKHMKVAEVAEYLMCSAAKVRRMESSFRAGTARDVRDLCAFYGVTSGESGHLVDLAHRSKDRAWQSFNLQYSTYAGLEEGAASIKGYQTSVVHGLLQTADYARALAESAWPRLSPESAVQTIEARLRRQRLLTGPDPLHASFILDEGVLRRLIGGRLVMSEQLRRLTEAASHLNVTIQVIPYQAGAHAGLESNFNLLEFVSPVESVVHTEGLFGNMYLEDPEQIVRFKSKFAQLLQAALSQEQSILLIQQIHDEIKFAP